MGAQHGVIWVIDSRDLRRAGLALFLMPWARRRGLEVRQVPHTGEINLGLPASLFLLSLGGDSLSAPDVINSIAMLKSASPDIPVALMHDYEASRAGKSYGPGVKALIPTYLTPQVAIAALDLVLAGGAYLPAKEKTAMPPKAFLKGPSTLSSDPDARIERASAQAGGVDADTLTARQLEVLKFLEDGQSNKEIARALLISEATVKIHVRHLMRKMGASNRTKVALLANKAHWHKALH